MDKTYLAKTAVQMVPGGITENFVTMEWDLETKGTPPVPLIAKIDIRKATLNGSVIGYEFKNPSLRLKDSAQTPYLVHGLNLLINNKAQTDITTYSNLEATINTKADINIALGLGNATAILTPQEDDVIALEFPTLKVTSGKIVPAPTPIPTPTPIGRVTYIQLISTGGVILNRCNICHSGSKPGAGLNMFNYDAAKAAAAKIKLRVNDAANPMPARGLMPQHERDVINAWVDQGAPLE